MYKISFLFLFGLALLFLPRTALASEATFELRSTTVESYRCFAASLQMQDLQYTITISCRDLVYPAAEEIFSYMVWTTPVDGSAPVRLGQLGFGKATFKTGKAFDSMFVTTEREPNSRSPQGSVVMRGSAQNISFLQRPTTPTPTPESGSVEEEEEESPTGQLSTRERHLVGLRRAGLVSLLAFVAMIGLVFVITRSRG